MEGNTYMEWMNNMYIFINDHGICDNNGRKNKKRSSCCGQNHSFWKKAVVNLLEILYNIKVAEMIYLREEYLNGK